MLQGELPENSEKTVIFASKGVWGGIFIVNMMKRIDRKLRRITPFWMSNFPISLWEDYQTHHFWRHQDTPNHFRKILFWKFKNWTGCCFFAKICPTYFENLESYNVRNSFSGNFKISKAWNFQNATDCNFEASEF